MSEPHSQALARRLRSLAVACDRHRGLLWLVAVGIEGDLGGRPWTTTHLQLAIVLALLAHPASGRVLVPGADLAAVLRIDASDLETTVRAFERARILRLDHVGPYLALSIRAWPASDLRSVSTPMQESAAVGQEFESGGPPSGPPPVLAKQQTAARAQPAAERSRELLNFVGRREEGVAGGEGKVTARDAFLDRAAAALGVPEKRRELEAVCLGRPRRLLESALVATLRTPPERIRKSRLALFVYLVNNAARQ